MKADEKFFRMAIDIASNSYSDEFCILYAKGFIGKSIATKPRKGHKLSRHVYEARWISISEYIDLITIGGLRGYEYIWNSNRYAMPRSIRYYAELYAVMHGGTLDEKAGRDSYAVAWIYLLFKSFIPGIIISIISWHIFNGGWMISVLFGAWCIFAIVNSLVAEKKRDKDLLHITTKLEFMNINQNRVDGEYDVRLLDLVYKYVDCEMIYKE